MRGARVSGVDNVVITEELRGNIVGVFGERGATWLEVLPLHLSLLERRWRIRIEAPFPRLSFNYAAPATDAEGRAVVLKTGVPCAELLQEIAALRLYAGRGSVRILRSSRRMCAMLLQRVDPGTMLSEMKDDEAATRIAAECMRALWVPLPGGHAFPSVERWADGLGSLRRRFGGGTGPLPTAAVERAEGLFGDLFASATETVLLHADLHHYNILRDGDAWRAIDPKGMAGEREYECGAWLRNPSDLLARPGVADLLDRRIAIFSEALGFDRERIRGWALAQAVLCAWWCLEDNGDCWQDSLALAEHLLALPGKI